MADTRRRWLKGVLSLTALSATPLNAYAQTRPALFLIGDSTIRNGRNDNGETAGQFGWGRPFRYYFDADRIQVVNDAMGGTSSRSYQTSPTLWPRVVPLIQPGDHVLIAFGHNDSRSSIPGNGEEERPLPQPPPGSTAAPPPPGTTMRSFGWYIRQYIRQVRERGATPVILSLIPRNRWQDGRVIRNGADYALWARQAAEQEGAAFIPLNDIIADKYDVLGQDHVTATFFPPKEVVHPNWTGAAFNAACVVEGLKALKSPLTGFLVAAPQVPLVPDIQPPAVGAPGPSGLEPKDRTAKAQ